MLQLAATTDKLQLTTSAAVNTDVHVSYVDHTLSGDNVEGNRQNTAITTATTTDILASPSSGVIRRVKLMTIRNKGTATQVVTVIFDANGTDYEAYKETLIGGEMLQYIEGLGFLKKPRAAFRAISEVLAADQVHNPDGALHTIMLGSVIKIPNDNPCRIGTSFRWTFDVVKTAASTASWVLSVRLGVSGTEADTARLTFTPAAGSAVIDTGFGIVQVVVRGPISSSCVIQGVLFFEHHNATSGLTGANHQVIAAASAAFDITLRDLVVSLSMASQATTNFTFRQTTAQVLQQ